MLAQHCFEEGITPFHCNLGSIGNTSYSTDKTTSRFCSIGVLAVQLVLEGVAWLMRYLLTFRLDQIDTRLISHHTYPSSKTLRIACRRHLPAYELNNNRRTLLRINPLA